MVSAAVATIIGAICAVLGVLIGTISTGLWTQRNESLKRRRQEQDAVRRYYDPLLRASQELQHQIRGLFRGSMAKVVITTQNSYQPDSLDYAKTLYLFGQFFAWNHAIRNAVHEMYHTPSEEDSKIRNVLHNIGKALDESDKGSQPTTFRILTVLQAAIGEIMLKKDSSGKVVSCIEFTDFLAKLSNNHVDEAGVAFQQWFDSIIAGLTTLCSIKEEFPSISQDPPDVSPKFPRCKLRRLMRFHHLLVELIDVLDPGQQRSPSYESRPIPGLDESCACICERCDSAKKPCRILAVGGTIRMSSARVFAVEGSIVGSYATGSSRFISGEPTLRRLQSRSVLVKSREVGSLNGANQVDDEGSGSHSHDEFSDSDTAINDPDTTSKHEPMESYSQILKAFI